MKYVQNSILKKAIAVFLIAGQCVVLPGDGYALAPWVTSDSAPAKAGMSAFLAAYSICHATTDDLQQYLAERDTDIAIRANPDRSAIQFIVTEALAQNEDILAWVLFRTEVRAYMRALYDQDRYTYANVRELLFDDTTVRTAYFDRYHKSTRPKSVSDETLINDLVARALQLLFLKRHNLPLCEGTVTPDMQGRTERFLDLTRAIITDPENRLTVFKDGLYIEEEDSACRHTALYEAIKEGMPLFPPAEHTGQTTKKREETHWNPRRPRRRKMHWYDTTERLEPDSPYLGDSASPIETSYLKRDDAFSVGVVGHAIEQFKRHVLSDVDASAISDDVREQCEEAKTMLLGTHHSFQTLEGEALFLRRFAAGLSSPQDIDDSLDLIRAFRVMPNRFREDIRDLIRELYAALFVPGTFDRDEIRGTYLEMLKREFDSPRNWSGKRGGTINFQKYRKPNERYAVTVVDSKTIWFCRNLLDITNAREICSRVGYTFTERDEALLERNRYKQEHMVDEHGVRTGLWKPEIIRILKKLAAHMQNVRAQADNLQAYYLQYIIQALARTVGKEDIDLAQEEFEYFANRGIPIQPAVHAKYDKFSEGRRQVRHNTFYYTAKVTTIPFNENITVNDLVAFLDLYVTQADLLAQRVNIDEEARRIHRHPGRSNADRCLPHLSHAIDGVTITHGVRSSSVMQDEEGDAVNCLILKKKAKHAYEEAGDAAVKLYQDRDEISKEFFTEHVHQMAELARKVAARPRTLVPFQTVHAIYSAFTTGRVADDDSGLISNYEKLALALSWWAATDTLSGAEATIRSTATHFLPDSIDRAYFFCNLRTRLTEALILEDVGDAVAAMVDNLDITEDDIAGRASSRTQEPLVETLINFLFNGIMPQTSPQETQAFFQAIRTRHILQAIQVGLERRQFRDIATVGLNLQFLHEYLERYDGDYDTRDVTFDYHGDLMDICEEVIDYFSTVAADIREARKIRSGNARERFFDLSASFSGSQNGVFSIASDEEPDALEYAEQSFLFQKLALAGSVIPARQFSSGYFYPHWISSSGVKADIEKGTSGFTSILDVTETVAAVDPPLGFIPLVYLDSGIFFGRTDFPTAIEFTEHTLRGFRQRGFRVLAAGEYSPDMRRKAQGSSTTESSGDGIIPDRVHTYAKRALIKKWPALARANEYCRAFYGDTVLDPVALTLEPHPVEPPHHMLSWETVYSADVLPRQGEEETISFERFDFTLPGNIMHLREYIRTKDPYYLQLLNPNIKNGRANIDILAYLLRLPQGQLDELRAVVAEILDTMAQQKRDPTNETVFATLAAELLVSPDGIIPKGLFYNNRFKRFSPDVERLLNAGIMEEKEDGNGWRLLACPDPAVTDDMLERYKGLGLFNAWMDGRVPRPEMTPEDQADLAVLEELRSRGNLADGAEIMGVYAGSIDGGVTSDGKFFEGAILDTEITDRLVERGILFHEEPAEGQHGEQTVLDLVPGKAEALYAECKSGTNSTTLTLVILLHCLLERRPYAQTVAESERHGELDEYLAWLAYLRSFFEETEMSGQGERRTYNVIRRFTRKRKVVPHDIGELHKHLRVLHQSIMVRDYLVARKLILPDLATSNERWQKNRKRDGSVDAKGLWHPRLDLTAKKANRIFEEHAEGINVVSVSPDGTVVASGDLYNTIKLWDARSGTCLWTKEIHPRGVKSVATSIAFSPDGKTLVSGSRDGMLRVWDVKTGTCGITREEHTEAITSIHFSPDGSKVLTRTDDGKLRVWGGEEGECLETIDIHNDTVESTAFSPDGKKFATRSQQGVINVWDAATQHCLVTLQGAESDTSTIAFSPDSKTILSAAMTANTGTKWQLVIDIWDVESGAVVRTTEMMLGGKKVGHTGRIAKVIFSPGRTEILTVAADRTMKLWDVRTGTHLKTFEGHETSIQDVVFSHDGKQIISASWDKTVRIWDVSNIVRNDVHVESGEVLFILGPNASGKSVFLNAMINAVVRPSAGFPIHAESVKTYPFKHVLFVSHQPFFSKEKKKKEDPFSTFLKRTHYAIQTAGPDTIVVIDELGEGCDQVALMPFYCAAIEAIAATGAAVVVATHMDPVVGHIRKRLPEGTVRILEGETDADGFPTHRFRKVDEPTEGVSHGRAIAKAFEWSFLDPPDIEADTTVTYPGPVALADAVRIIYNNYGHAPFRQQELFREYRGITRTTIRMLMKLGMLRRIQAGTYRLSETLEGPTSEATLQLIRALYNIISEESIVALSFDTVSYVRPERIPFMRELAKNVLIDQYARGTVTDNEKECPQINMWSGYARSTEQKTVLQELRHAASEHGFILNFGDIRDEDESIKKLVDYAIGPEGSEENTVTILPSDHAYVIEHMDALKTARVIFMDYDEWMKRPESFFQISGIIASGIAYINDNDEVLTRLYRLLTDTEGGAVSVSALRKNPLSCIFHLKPIVISDPEEQRVLNERMHLFGKAA